MPSSKMFVTRVYLRLRNHTFDGDISEGGSGSRQSETTFAHKVDYACVGKMCRATVVVGL